MDYNSYGRGVAPTPAGGGSRPPLSSLPSNQSYFILSSLRESRALPHHLPLSSYTPAAAPLPSGALPRDNLAPFNIHMPGTHLGARAIPSPYDVSLQSLHVVPNSSSRANDFREPMGRSTRQPYREMIGMPGWDPMRVSEPRSHQNVARRKTIRGNRERELVRRDRDRVSSHDPVYQRRSRPQQIIARNRPEGASSTTRIEAQLQRLTRALQRDNKLTSPSRTVPVEHSLFSSSDDDSRSVPVANREPKQNLQVRPEKESLEHELNKKTYQGLQPMFTERSEKVIPTKENEKAPEIPQRPGWCSLCKVDCVTKEVLHKSHAFGKKHQYMLKKLEEVLGDGKESPQLMGWCSLCEVDCKTMEALHGEHTFGKKHQYMLKKLEEVLGDGKESPQLMGWCSLCEVDCKTMEALHGEHTLSEKHQLMLGIPQKPQMKQHEEVQETDNITGKRKQQMKEEGSISSKKRQKLSVLNLECKICSKEFTSQVVLESHLSGKKHAAQLKTLANPEAPSEVNVDKSKKSAGVDGQESDNSKLVVVAKYDPEAASEEDTVMEAKDDREVSVKIGNDDSKESTEPNEVEGKNDNAHGDKVKELVTVNVKVEPGLYNMEVAAMENNTVEEKSKAHVECKE